MRRAVRLAPVVLLAACGAAQDDRPPPIVIAVAAVADGGVRDGAPSADATLAPPVDSGWGGPVEARDLVGPAGAVVVGTPRALLLVHSSAIRADARRTSLRAALLGALPGWNQFVPYDVVDPIADVDWVLVAGSIVFGQTESNVFLARYALDEAKADAAMQALQKRLRHGRPAPDFGAPTHAFIAEVDDAERLYVRPRPGVLAIVPVAEGRRVVDLLALVDVPADVRPGELVRIVDNDREHFASVGAPQITRGRYVATASDDTTSMRLEGDCPTPDDARAAATALRANLRAYGQRVVVQLVAPWLLRVAPEAVGAEVRATAVLDEDDLAMIAAAACRGGCP